MKSNRQNVILSIIAKQDIETQNHLLEALAQRGIQTTQATLSRDIRELHLKKTADADGNIHYTADTRDVPSIPQIFRDSVINADHAMNTVVFKCHTGMAQGACAVFDKLEYRGVVGTLAGDDTFFVLMRTAADAEYLVDEMKFLLGTENISQ